MTKNERAERIALGKKINSVAASWGMAPLSSAAIMGGDIKRLRRIARSNEQQGEKCGTFQQEKRT